MHYAKQRRGHTLNMFDTITIVSFHLLFLDCSETGHWMYRDYCLNYFPEAEVNTSLNGKCDFLNLI